MSPTAHRIFSQSAELAMAKSALYATQGRIAEAQAQADLAKRYFTVIAQYAHSKFNGEV